MRQQIVNEIMSLVRQQPKKMEPPPTIEELEKILNSETTDQISIESDGTVSARPTVTTVGAVADRVCFIVDAEITRLTAEVTALKAANEEMRTAKDGAYHERDMVVAALSKCFTSYLSRHSDEDTAWEDDWRWIVYIELPTGQASWHIHDSERDLFNHLEVRPNNWDGHNTERKYRRLAAVRTTITYIDEWKNTERKLHAAELANEEMRGRLEQENSELWAHLGEARAMSERLRGRLEKAERVVSAVAALRQKQAITMDDQQRVWDALSVYLKET